MPKTYEPIATQTVGTATSAVNFTSIPQTYTDLVMVMNSKGSTANYPRVIINSDSGSNYSRTYLTGTGTAAVSGRSANITGNASLTAYAVNSSSEFVLSVIVHFFNYSNTTTYKSILTKGIDANTGVDLTAILWRSNSAINNLSFQVDVGNFAVGSTLTLYGIKAA
jgi:hypothetical protein